MMSADFSGVLSIFIPSASEKSAAPLLLDTARLPCFATERPHEAAAIADIELILKLPLLSPPVPTISVTSSVSSEIGVFFLQRTDAHPAISDAEGFFTEIAVRIAAV